jgi:hypothetical protein
MPKRRTAFAVAKTPATNVLERVIGIAPAELLAGETEADYLSVAQRIVAVAQSKDAIEEFLTRDIVDLTWEVFRLRRVKAALLRASAGEGVSKILSTTGNNEFSFVLPGQPNLAQKWARGDASARVEFANILKKAELTMDEVMAETFAKQIDFLERLDRMLASAETRRNNALREIDRHREALGARVRQAIHEVQDAEFRDVETGEQSGRPLP